MTTLSAANTFAPAVNKQAKVGYSISIIGTFVGTITLQRSKDGITWVDFASYTVPAELDGEFGTQYYVRAGFKTGGWTSGSADVYVY
jgi:hypothetical protein